MRRMRIGLKITGNPARQRPPRRQSPQLPRHRRSSVRPCLVTSSRRFKSAAGHSSEPSPAPAAPSSSIAPAAPAPKPSPSKSPSALKAPSPSCFSLKAPAPTARSSCASTPASTRPRSTMPSPSPPPPSATCLQDGSPEQDVCWFGDDEFLPHLWKALGGPDFNCELSLRRTQNLHQPPRRRRRHLHRNPVDARATLPGRSIAIRYVFFRLGIVALVQVCGRVTPRLNPRQACQSIRAPPGSSTPGIRAESWDCSGPLPAGAKRRTPTAPTLRATTESSSAAAA